MYSLWKSGKNKVRGLQKRINLKINFLLGTKAQFIKTIPVINEAIKRGLDVTLFDLKQHAKTTEGLKEKIDDKCNLSKDPIIKMGNRNNICFYQIIFL